MTEDVLLQIILAPFFVLGGLIVLIMLSMMTFAMVVAAIDSIEHARCKWNDPTCDTCHFTNNQCTCPSID